jgi:phosphate/sulfate permease
MITTNRCYGRPARLLAASACLVAFAMGAAQAQVSQAEISAVKANCRSDYMAHCMSVRPGGKEALQCLQSHLDSLTGTCKGAVAATMPKPAPPPAAAAPPPPPPHKAAKAPPPHPTALSRLRPKRPPRRPRHRRLQARS